MAEKNKLNEGDAVTLSLTSMANGGAAMGRDSEDRAIFVPFTIPGEKVMVEITSSKARYAHGRAVEILTPSDERIEPKCKHFGVCGGCHFQHIDYSAQLRYKEHVIRDQLQRIGKFESPPIRPVLANPEPWSYSSEAVFYPSKGDKLGFWSPFIGEIIPIAECPILKEELQEIFQQVDLNLPSLRRLLLRASTDEGVLAALEIGDSEAPSLETDLPISVNLIISDGTTVNLIGDNHTVHEIKGRTFRATASSDFYPSAAAAEVVIDAVLEFVSPVQPKRIVELFSGVGLLTAFLAGSAKIVEGVESSADAVADLAANLEDKDNVSLYQGEPGEILPILDKSPDVMVLQPPASGLKPDEVDKVALLEPQNLIYVSSDIATLARDGRRLAQKGFDLLEVQPVDMRPQTFHALTISHWEAGIPR
jgi:23S rRNA (uracil1939-C5)-methyltransferase